MSSKEKWTEEKALALLQELKDWMFETEDILDRDGNKIGERDKGNVLWKDFLYRKGLYDMIIYHLREKFSTFERELEDVKAIQEHRLQVLGLYGVTNPNMTKFVLQNKHGWKEKVENENKNTNVTWNETKTYLEDK
jgi:hypothetical protein